MAVTRSSWHGLAQSWRAVCVSRSRRPVCCPSAEHVLSECSAAKQHRARRLLACARPDVGTTNRAVSTSPRYHRLSFVITVLLHCNLPTGHRRSLVRERVIPFSNSPYPMGHVLGFTRQRCLSLPFAPTLLLLHETSASSARPRIACVIFRIPTWLGIQLDRGVLGHALFHPDFPPSYSPITRYPTSKADNAVARLRTLLQSLHYPT